MPDCPKAPAHSVEGMADVEQLLEMLTRIPPESIASRSIVGHALPSNQPVAPQRVRRKKVPFMGNHLPRQWFCSEPRGQPAPARASEVGVEQ